MQGLVDTIELARHHELAESFLGAATWHPREACSDYYKGSCSFSL